jgi:mannonate dehydratase
MQMALRWFGPSDPVRLEYIRQIPGVDAVVSALYDIPPGNVWKRESVAALQDEISSAGMHLRVIESIPVHEEIKLGQGDRERYTENYCESLRVLGELGVDIVCYNFMPIFDWFRTNTERPLDDGSLTLAYDHQHIEGMDSINAMIPLPGWPNIDVPAIPIELFSRYREVDSKRLWDNLAWFLERVIPVAEESGVRMAMHPDDPPWPIFGLPRILTDAAAFDRLIKLVDSPANGVTFCTGSLGASPDNDLPAMIRQLGPRIHFAHCRNVKRTGNKQFNEVAHPSKCGDVDMLSVMRALRAVGFDGIMRPDHGRMIWGEQGRPGYGLYDRALGATYLQGLWEAITSESNG